MKSFRTSLEIFAKVWRLKSTFQSVKLRNFWFFRIFATFIFFLSQKIPRGRWFLDRCRIRCMLERCGIPLLRRAGSELTIFQLRCRFFIPAKKRQDARPFQVFLPVEQGWWPPHPKIFLHFWPHKWTLWPQNLGKETKQQRNWAKFHLSCFKRFVRQVMQRGRRRTFMKRLF